MKKPFAFALAAGLLLPVACTEKHVSAEALAHDPKKVAALALKAEQDFESRVAKGAKVTLMIGVCAVIGEPSANGSNKKLDVFIEPSPASLTINNPSGSGEIDVVAGYNPFKRKFIYGPPVVLDVNKLASYPVRSDIQEEDLIPTTPGQPPHSSMIRFSKDSLLDEQGNMRATVISAGTTDNLDAFASSDLTRTLCMAANRTPATT